ncbi:arsenate reductase ArsC [Seleniivibrio sp.]|uniref:arsenate reductase ArsC n=1 Tax=Seleniivibrio sp. TaxID=2898801 RepID=UPI0025F21B9C|nr:arsenate reductase ArsC [Seleniivibrio sp.]MCD8555012.1 arsenate reductase ArsC [Seleniivibrio sp.]
MAKKVLFVCVHNSARSQMAEAYLNAYSLGRFEAESAGLEPGELNPYVIKVMAEEGIDISGNSAKSVFDFFKQGKLFNYVITVCDTEASERCPIFPGITSRIHWSFPDPSTAAGSEEEKLAYARKIRDMVKQQIVKFLDDVN